jgi:hypothetical protein
MIKNFENLTLLEKLHVQAMLAATHVVVPSFTWKGVTYVRLPSGKITTDAGKVSSRLPDYIVLMNGVAALNGITIGDCDTDNLQIYRNFSAMIWNNNGTFKCRFDIEKEAWVSEELAMTKISFFHEPEVEEAIIQMEMILEEEEDLQKKLALQQELEVIREKIQLYL